MPMKIVNNNAPDCLIKLGEKWAYHDKSFYLGPENIFKYGYTKIEYHGANEVSSDWGAWSLSTEDCLAPVKLTTQEIEEVARAFAENTSIELAFLYITDKCNLKCPMCIYHGNKDSSLSNFNKSNQKFLNFEVAKKYIDRIVELGAKCILLTTNGEPLLHPEFLEICDYISNFKNIGVSVISNGTLVTEEFCEKASKVVPKLGINLSLHAVTFETWNKITACNNRNMFEVAMNAPVLLKKYGFNFVGVKLVNQQENAHEIEPFISKWFDKVDAVEIAMCNMVPPLELSNDLSVFPNEPLGICMSSYGRIVVDQDGVIFPCCCMLYLRDSENTYELPEISCKDGVDSITMALEEYWNKSGMYIGMCKKCASFLRYNQCFETKSYGYNSIDQGDTILITKELNSGLTNKSKIRGFIKRIKDKLK